MTVADVLMVALGAVAAGAAFRVVATPHVVRAGLWLVVTLGAVLFFASLTAFSATTFLHIFTDKLPFGHEVATVVHGIVPSFSVLLLILILALFYRTIPNTHVVWRAAFIGALVGIVVANFIVARRKRNKPSN